MADEPVPQTPSSPTPAAPAPSPAAPPAAASSSSPTTAGVSTPPTAPPLAPQPAPASQPAAAAPPARPEWLPEGFADPVAFRAKYDELSTRFAAEDIVKATLPAKPEDYKIALPKDFKPPEGIDFKFNENDPLMPQVRAVAHKYGISQDALSDFLSLYAGAQVQERQQFKMARDAELSKLGANATARITYINQFLDGIGAGALKERIWNANDVAAFEKLASKYINGGTTFNTLGRDQPTNTISDADWAKMSFADRTEYARKHPQPNLNGSGR